MIGSLRGVVLHRLPPAELLIEVGGVGYRVTVAPSTLAAAGVGEPLLLHVHTHVREDAIVLFGFATADERRCFEALLAAHGVGPGLAMAILSALAPAGLHRALATGDVEALTRVPGVGRKTAARLLIELRSEVLEGLEILAGGPAGAAGSGAAIGEVRAALTGLGYGPDEVQAAMRELPSDARVEDMLKSALKQLASAR
ncbi:MAG TPA: Holliday junction branch migration protein RuvA [Acidimicrobiales bacterium]|nr:Holliday junction branch migration protein RuvA [Acidimicrobiales bacterium]